MMNKIRKTLLLLAVTLSVSAFSGEKIIFSEKFDSPDALKKWNIVEYPQSGTFHIENGALSVNHKHQPGKGSYIEIPIPSVKRGIVEFDVLIDPDRINPAAKIGLTFEIYNIATFWHDSCEDWRLYFPEPNAKKLPHFDVEPVGHSRIATVPQNRYVHYKILFDEQKDLVEFYADDMRDPKAARYDISVFGHAFYRGGYLRIGSFGFTTDPYRTLVDNVTFKEISSEDKAVVKDQILIFDGITCDEFNAYELLKKENFWNKTGARRYTWNSPTPNIKAGENNFQYEGMPGLQTVEQATLVIFNDAPNVHPALQKQILASVKNGADLLILGGFFTLGKGDFKDSILGNMLPVDLSGSIWGVGGNDKKLYSLRTVPPFSWDAKGKTLSVFWDLKPSSDSEILMTAFDPSEGGRKDIPILLRKKYGNGWIYVLTGTACGSSPDTIFWKSDFLKSLLSTIHSE